MPSDAPPAIKALALVHAPVEIIYDCVFQMEDWPSYVPRVKKMNVRRSTKDPNEFQTEVTLSLPGSNKVLICS